MIRLVLSVRFVDDRYHGLLTRNGPPEWPPSPFRLFSALVAGVGRRGELEGEIGKALAWLQALEPPIIIAPKAKTGQAITRFVPNNDGDKKPDRQERLTAKPTIPTLMLLGPDEKPQVHYVWDVTDPADVPLDRIREAARSLTTLGWGVDMAFADAMLASEADIQRLSSVRWYPKPGAWRDSGMLRVPTVDSEHHECTLGDLKHCHETTISRIEHGKPLHTVDKPRVFDQIFYSSVERPIGRPHRIFKLRQMDGDRFRYSPQKLIHIAGMVRHMAIEAMKASPPRDVDSDWVETYVAGHAKGDGDEHRQLSFLPLPSIGHPHADPGVRRVMIAAPVGDDDLLEYVARALKGAQLDPLRGDEFAGNEPPLLVLVQNDNVARFYTRPSNAWASVTPVILPGHDDRKPGKRIKLIEKALAQSGIEQPCEFEWSPFSHFPKSYSAHKYDKDKRPQGYIRPDHLLSQTAVHLKICFKDGLKVPGPLVIGAGRHCGFGLMAGIDDE